MLWEIDSVNLFLQLTTITVKRVAKKKLIYNLPCQSCLTVQFIKCKQHRQAPGHHSIWWTRNTPIRAQKFLKKWNKNQWLTYILHKWSFLLLHETAISTQSQESAIPTLWKIYLRLHKIYSQNLLSPNYLRNPVLTIR